MSYYTFTVQNEVGKRIDIFLSEELEELSRSRIQSLIKSGEVLVNEKIINKSYELRADDRIEFTLPEPVKTEIEPENIPIDIIYEDKDLLVVNKPRGMVVHPAAGHTSQTLVNALMYACDSLSGINGELRPGIVHRIDKDTSGLLVVAKNDVSHRALAQQFSVHSITRIYHAITQNRVGVYEGTIDKPIGRNPNDRKKMAVTEKNSKRAVTHFKVTEEFSKHSLIECRLETGRTHQIRVHMAYIGHPILGDTVYGAKKQPYGIEGQILHAKTLGFIHPSTGEYMEFTSDYPDYFKEISDKLKK